MQIIGFNLKSISAERTDNQTDKLEITSNIEIKDVTKDSIELMKDKFILKFDFEFSIQYKPEIANIKFKGFITAIVEKSQQKEILDQWQEKKIPEESRLLLFNLILAKCSLRALSLEEELNLPTHFPLPKIIPQKNQPKDSGLATYTG